MGELESWRRKKTARMAEYDELQGQINAICESLGMPVGPKKKAKNSITRGNMEFLKLELERMRGEKVCDPLCILWSWRMRVCMLCIHMHLAPRQGTLQATVAESDVHKDKCMVPSCGVLQLYSCRAAPRHHQRQQIKYELEHQSNCQ